MLHGVTARQELTIIMLICLHNVCRTNVRIIRQEVTNNIFMINMVTGTGIHPVRWCQRVIKKCRCLERAYIVPTQ